MKSPIWFNSQNSKHHLRLKVPISSQDQLDGPASSVTLLALSASYAFRHPSDHSQKSGRRGRKLLTCLGPMSAGIGLSQPWTTHRWSKQWPLLGLIVGPSNAPKGKSADVIHAIYVVQKMHFPLFGHFCLHPHPQELGCLPHLGLSLHFQGDVLDEILNVSAVSTSDLGETLWHPFPYCWWSFTCPHSQGAHVKLSKWPTWRPLPTCKAKIYEGPCHPTLREWDSRLTPLGCF